jgi:hypothetical protein
MYYLSLFPAEAAGISQNEKHLPRIRESGSDRLLIPAGINRHTMHCLHTSRIIIKNNNFHENKTSLHFSK